MLLSYSHSTLLGLSRLLLWILRAINLITAVLLAGSLVATFVFEPNVREFFLKRPTAEYAEYLMPILRIWMLLAAPMIAVVHILLSRMLDMLETVRIGDPFVPENAVRMNMIAWCMLAIELLRLAFGAMAAMMNAAGSDIDWEFSLNGWLAVLLLFVLARIFEEGTRIRDDLEAMV
jgi:hypothetical protein